MSHPVLTLAQVHIQTFNNKRRKSNTRCLFSLQIERLKTEKQTVEDFLMDAQQSASTVGEENKRLLEARRREQERWEEERAQSKHIVQEMEAEVRII